MLRYKMEEQVTDQEEKKKEETSTIAREFSRDALQYCTFSSLDSTIKKGVKLSIHTLLFALTLLPNLMNVRKCGKICLPWRCQMARIILLRILSISTSHQWHIQAKQFTVFPLIARLRQRYVKSITILSMFISLKLYY